MGQLHSLDNLMEGIQIIDRDFRYVFLNQAALDHAGLEKEELIGNSMVDLYPGIDQTPMFQTLKDVMQNRQSKTIENCFEYPDGRKEWFALHVCPHQDGITVHSFNITEKKNYEVGLYQNQKLEALGRLAGGVAHDLVNKLAIIDANAKLLERVLKKNNIDKKQLNTIQKTLQSAVHLSRKLLAFSSKQVLKFEPTVLDELIGEIIEELKSAFPENITLEMQLNAHNQLVNVDQTQLDQIIMNLCINARDATSRGGTIVVKTSKKYLDKVFCKDIAQIVPGDYLEIDVSDDGDGIPPDVLKNIFVPFFTTKEMGKGTGLGLATVMGIVKQFRGHIEVSSEVGHGTTFKIYLPVFKGEMREAEESAAQQEFAKKSHLLLVEDNDDLCDAIAANVELMGFGVHTASTAAEGIEIFEKFRGEIAVVLTDVVLPDLDGLKMMDRIRENAPKVEVIYVTGYGDDYVNDLSRVNFNDIVLQKPVDFDELFEVISKKVA